MDEPTEIEKLILDSRSRPPAGFRAEIVDSIHESSRAQTRRDDFRTYLGGIVLLVLVSLILLGTLTVHHSMLIQSILSTN